LLGAGILGVIAIAFLRGVFLTLLVAVVLAYILDPIVTALSRIRFGRRLVPRWVIVIVLYLVLFGGIGTLGRLVVPRLASEIAVLATQAPRAFQRAKQWIPAVEREIRDRLRAYLPAEEPAPRAGRPTGIRITKASGGAFDVELGSSEIEVHQIAEGRWRVRPVPPGPAEFDLGRAVGEAVRGALGAGQGQALNVLSIARSVVQGTIEAFFGILVTMMIAAYLLADKDRIIGFVSVLFPPRLRPSWEQLLVKLERGLAGVLRGQLIICLVNGTLSGIGFWWLDLPYWPLLTAIATLLSIIPVFGAIISSIPAVLLALTISWQVAVAALAWILGIHALEAYFLNPKIIGTAARIHPVLVLTAIVAGERSYGIVGALLAVPFASIGQTIFVYLRNRAYHEETEPPLDGDAGSSDSIPPREPAT
jgi:predicted PurR-regulated permease PerM